MSTTPLLIDRVEADGAVLLYLRGELDLGSAPLLRAALARLGGRTVVIDLGDLTFMDSTGLAVLLENRREDGGLRIRGATGRVRALLERTGVLAVLAVEETAG